MPRCCDQARPIDNRPVTQVDVDGTQHDVESNFCYLGDILCAGGGCKLAIITRWSTAWGKFKRLLPILTSKHVSLRTRGKVSTPVCVLPYYMVVKPGHLLHQTCSGIAGMTDQWSLDMRSQRWWRSVCGHTLCNVRNAGGDSSSPH